MTTYVARSTELIWLAHQAEAHGLNRQVDTARLAKDLAPEGYHLLTRVLPFHDRGIIDDPDHGRYHVTALVKPGRSTKDIEGLPFTEFFLDITDEDFDAADLLRAHDREGNPA